MLGRFTLEALKHDWIEYLAGGMMVVGLIAFLILMTYFKKWKWLWKDWITSVDHKKIGIMYLVVSFVMLIKGLIDAVMMRAQQATAFGDSMGYLGAEHFQQIFTAHGVTMIFFVGMGLLFAIINYIVPLQIGARDVAFPFLNNVSFWLFAMGAMMILVSLVIGVYAGTGWSAYPPLAGLKYNPGVGVDYWVWSIQISGIGSTLSGINFLATILKMRCKGMTLMKMPIFTWATLITSVLIVFAFPILTADLSLLTTDRLLETKIFTESFGGRPMMYVNLFWAWGHPEVYILILPAFGMFSEVVPVFSKKRLFGYASMVWALAAIAFFSFIVWLHHFFTMGAGANVNSFFGIMTMIVAIPTGVKVFNWLFTLFRGKVKFTSAMLWFIGFIIVFVSGGMTGVLMSLPGADFQIHNSLFLVAHFHSVIIGGVVFGFFAGYTYWFPKLFGFKLIEKWGVYSFWCWIIGYCLAFLPLYLLGMMGVTRRLNYFEVPQWQPLFVIAFIGALVITAGVGFQVLQLYLSIKHRKENWDTTGDPWDGRTLEWSTSSPPPFYNFAHIPEVDAKDAFWAMKQKNQHPAEKKPYHEIHMPSNSPYGFWIGILSFTCAFGLIWWMFWLAAISGIGILIAIIGHLFLKEPEYYVTKEEVEKIEGEAHGRA